MPPRLPFDFIGVTGMLEMIFIDADGASTAIGGRPVKGALTYTLIEGFILQTMIQGTGMAMLELAQKIHLTVRVGDTIHAVVTVTGIRPTSREPGGGQFGGSRLQPAQGAGDDVHGAPAAGRARRGAPLARALGRPNEYGQARRDC